MCREWDLQTVCSGCTGRFLVTRPRCAQCAAVVPDGVIRCGSCLVNPPHFDSACAAVDYVFPWNVLLLRMKFHDGLELLPFFANCMLGTGPKEARLPAGLVVPVPLHAQRMRERGFNQAWELARRLAPAVGCKAQSSLLIRIRDTPHQVNLSKTQRQSAVRGAFVVDPLRRAEITGQRITVVDDVLTTLATANEVARTLKLAGAQSVHLWCFARTPDNNDPS